MRPIRKISAEEEHFRLERVGAFDVIRRDPVEPEPVGTIILVAFRITGYDPDCDGSLMARIESIDCNGNSTGWTSQAHGLYPNSNLVVTLEELENLWDSPEPPDSKGEE